MPVETIYRGGNSKARNPKIQNMLRMIGFGENVGSGFPKIIAAWKETGWGEPELKNKIEVDEVELVLPVSAVTTNVVKELTDRQQVILGLIKENPSLSASEMSQKTGMVTRTIQRDLASLHEKGILTREGGRKDGKWVIII